MSKLDELIQELCPDGVEYKAFFDIAKYIRGVTYNKSCEITDGSDGYKLLRANNITLANNSLNLDDIKTINFGVKVKDEQFLKKDDILICAGSGSKDHIGKVAFISEDMKYTFGGFMGVIRANIKFISPRYLYHILTSKMFKEHLYKISDANSTTINNINNNTWKKFFVPIPPLEVQKEIVRLLDEFTAKTAELQTELNKEYEVRKKQYEYYRDSLFSDKLNDLSLELCPNGVQYCELKEIADISTGSHNTNEGVENGMYPFYVRSQEPLTLNSYDYDETAIITAGDGVGVGKVFHFVNGKYALHQRAYRIHANTTKIEDKFLYYYFCTNFMKYIEKTMFKGSVPSIRRPMLNAFKIPVPPLEVQQEIVRLLDDFTAKTTKLQDSLNEELEACKKQYEFYRDKLLTFKELNESEVN